MLCIALSLLVPTAAAAQPITQNAPEHQNDGSELEKRAGVFVHRKSGFLYPAQLGEMPARKTTTYGPGNASIYYTRFGAGNNDAWLSLYVYPASGRNAVDDVPDIEGPIMKYEEAVKAAPPVGLSPGPPGSLDGWFRANLQGIQVLTGYRLIRSGNWFIKVRTSIPLKGGAEAEKRATDAMAAIPWSWQPNGAGSDTPSEPANVSAADEGSPVG